MYTIFLVIIIGFDPATYQVNENGGTVTLTVRMFNATITEGRNIQVRVTIVSGSAQGTNHGWNL